MISFQFYPKNIECPKHLCDVIKVFNNYSEDIASPEKILPSNGVLAVVKPGLEGIGYTIEDGKKAIGKISIPVLHGLNGKVDKSFDADGYNAATRTVIEVEAGRAVTNYQFLKDLFQSCMMEDVDFLVIAVRNEYSGHKDFQTVNKFMDTMYASRRLTLPLKGILVVGY